LEIHFSAEKLQYQIYREALLYRRRGRLLLLHPKRKILLENAVVCGLELHLAGLKSLIEKGRINGVLRSLNSIER